MDCTREIYVDHRSVERAAVLSNHETSNVDTRCTYPQSLHRSTIVALHRLTSVTLLFTNAEAIPICALSLKLRLPNDC